MCTVAFKCFTLPACSLMIREALDCLSECVIHQGVLDGPPVELIFSGCHLETKMAADKVFSSGCAEV